MQRVFGVFVLLCLGASLQALTTHASGPVVTIKSGQVQGLVLRSAKNEDFFAFRGIPYAKSPDGPRRFKPPQPVDPWSDVFDATTFGPECPQFNYISRGVDGIEDCLVLNVYTPQLPSSPDKPHKPKSVLVFIHGGGFLLGTGSYVFLGPERLIDYSVVLVTINYRLGVLGFLSTGDEASPGNYGMLDQVLALKWVKDNIASFGGDPDKVTIFGESAGAASVIYHILSPLSKGLFRMAIAQSGSPLNHWALQKHPLHVAQDVAKLVDCPIYDTGKLMDCIKDKSVYELVRKPFNMQISTLFPIFFAPVVEPQHGQHGFLTENPHLLLKSGKIANKVPLILGVTELEFFSFHHDLLKHYKHRGREHLDKEFPTILPFLYDMESSNANVYKHIFEAYFGDFNIKDEDKFEEIHIEMLGDAGFGIGVAQTAELYSRANIPTWTYMYSHVGQFSLSVGLGTPQGKWASHADELFIQFPFFYAKATELNMLDEKMAHILNSLWTSFTNGEDLSITTDETTVQWKNFNASTPNYLRLNLKPEMTLNKLVDKYEFWTETLPSLSNKFTTKSEL